jgi:CRP/FNR family transcriptional regulator
VPKTNEDQTRVLNMATLRTRSLSGQNGTEPCASCGARNSSICAAMEDRDLARLAALAVPIPIPVGRTFITEGDPAEHFFNVTAGTAKLFKLLPDGRRQITGFASTGTFLGLAVSSSYAFSAEAVDATRICRFSRTRLRRLLDDFPAMEKRLLEVASNELVAAQEQMLLLGRKTARERVASFLLARDSVATGEGAAFAARRVSLPMARTDIADYLGLTVETVSRTMTRLRRDRLIEMPSPTEILLRNHAALAQLAAGLS